STAGIRRHWTLRGHLRGLGVTSAMVGRTLTYGPSLTSGASPVFRPVGPARYNPTPITPAQPTPPITGPQPVWGNNPPGGGGGIQSGTGWWQQNNGGGGYPSSGN